MKFAFENQQVDALHCICEDYNVRSRRVFEKNGFKQVLEEKLYKQGIGEFRYHLQLARSEYIAAKEENR